jgi:mutator protein MutT
MRQSERGSESESEETFEGEARIVVAAVVERGGRCLVALRPEGKRHGGMWEFPGGKLDPGESLLDAVRRELLEELAMEVESVGPTLGIVQDPGSEFAIHFVEIRASGSPEALEHTELRWCSLEEMREIRLAPADASFVETLLSREASSPRQPPPLR